MLTSLLLPFTELDITDHHITVGVSPLIYRTLERWSCQWFSCCSCCWK